ncbi:putative amidohydrolase [Rhodococcus triatomae BKS 15-14]|nr:putative amidohydrolase [Rhodococcus triatomae BKS 15-14]
MFPYRDDHRYTSPVQPLEHYLEMLDSVGITYGVLVQPSVYAFDNSCLLAALDAAPNRLIGVVDIDILATADDELASMSRRGVRGLRVAWKPVHSTKRLREVGARLHDIGWHLDLRVDDIAHWAQLAPTLAEFPVPVMVESMGSPHAGLSVHDAGGVALLNLIDDADVWVKLSHPYQIDGAGPPYNAALPFARNLLAKAPDRMVWGSDWPHPMDPPGTVPDDAELVDLLLHWSDDQDLATKVLCDNPARFYGPPPNRSPQTSIC